MRQKKSLRAVVVVVVFLLAGCAHMRAAQYRKTLDSWMGSDISQVIVQWGPPSTTYLMPDGRTAYTWLYDGGAVAAPVMGTMYAIPRGCTTTLIAGSDNRVQSWQFRGNAC